MKTAIITPWPNAQTGIAEYSYNLAQSLNKLTPNNLTIYTNAKKNIALKKVNIKPIEKFPLNYQTYDRVIYHIGNNFSQHGHMINLIKNYPGIVHLHDMALHHLLAQNYLLKKEPDLHGYLQMIQLFYTDDIAAKVKNLCDDECFPWEVPSILRNMPLYEPVLVFAKAVIVHSQFVKAQITKRFPTLPIEVIPQRYNNLQKKENTYQKNKVKIGTFGFNAPEKKVNLIIHTLNKLALKNQEKIFTYYLNGCFDDNTYSYIQQYVTASNLEVICQKMGSTKKFNQEIANVDLCISLRNPTMGETSAIVSKCMQIGTPVFVSDHGWYKDLPQAIKKIDINDEAESLKTHLNLFIEKQPEILLEAISLANDLEVSLYNEDKVSHQYLQFITDFGGLEGYPNKIETSEIAQNYTQAIPRLHDLFTSMLTKHLK